MVRGAGVRERAGVAGLTPTEIPEEEPAPTETSAPTEESSRNDYYLWANPVVLGVSAVIALVLLLFVPFPAELLNATISEQYDRVAETRTPGWWTDFRNAIDRIPILSGSILILIAAVIFGFVDPRFGWDIVSLRVVRGSRGRGSSCARSGWCSQSSAW